MKKRYRRNGNSTSFFVATLAVVVIIVVLSLAFIMKLSKSGPVDNTLNPDPNKTENLLNMISTSQSTLQSTLQTEQVGSTQATQQAGQTQIVAPGFLVKQEAGSIAAKDRVKYKIDHFKKLALQPLEFDVFDEHQKALTPNDLKTVRLHKMHYIVVSANLKEFQHLYPEYQDGKWKVLAYLPTPGTYYAYVDIAPVKGDPVVLRSDLIVRAPTSGSIVYPTFTPKLTLISGNYTIQLNLTNPTIYQQTILSFQITGGDNNVQPYGGELGQVTLFHENDPDGFMHSHILPSSNALQGLAQFLTTFNKPGPYVAFAEFKFSNKVYVFSIVFEVKAS